MRISCGLKLVTLTSRRLQDSLATSEVRTLARNWCTTLVHLSTGWAKDLMSKLLSLLSGILLSMGE